MPIEVQITGDKKLNKMFRNMDKVWKLYEVEVKRGTLELESVVKKDFLTVRDGNVNPADVAGGRALPRRRKRPGLRAVSRNLLRNTRSAFRRKRGVLEGAVGTNVKYGVIQERKGTYAFLEPAIKKYFPTFKARLNKILKANLRVR